MTVTAEAVTFAEAAVTGLETVMAARGILDRAKDCPWPDGAESRKVIQDAIWPLVESLETYGRPRVGIIRPEDAIPGLEARPGALAEALDEIAEGVSKKAARVVWVIKETCGDDAAAKVRGSKGEQSWPTR